MDVDVDVVVDEFQSIVLNSISSVSGTLSVLGSTSIIYMILSDRERKLGRPYHRLILMMSCFDVLHSLAIAISPLPLPLEGGVYGAKGNLSTCMAQGVLLILGLAVPLYNSGLNIFYMLTIRYSFSPERFAKYEPALHATAIIIPISLAIKGIISNNMEVRGIMCVPRSKLSATVVTVLYIANFLICISTMISICWKVNFQTTRVRQYTYATNRIARRSNTTDKTRNETVKQAFLYFLAFMLSHTWLCINALIVRGRKEIELPFALLILTVIFYPLQGFWNFCFYIRPTVKYVMQQNLSLFYFQAVYGIIFDRTLELGSPRSRRRSSMMSRMVSPPIQLSAKSNPLGERRESNVRYQSDDNHLTSPATSNFPISVPMDDDIHCETAERIEYQINSANERTNNTPLSIVDAGSVLSDKDILEVSTIRNISASLPDGKLEI